MNNNIEFSIVPNKTNTKFKIAWTINLSDYPMTKIMPREFGSEEAAQDYIDRNKETLAQKIRERISKIAINLKEIDVEPTAEVQEEIIEATQEEVAEETESEELEETEEVSKELSDEEVVDELATELPEIEETVEETEEVSEELSDEEVIESEEKENNEDEETTEELTDEVTEETVEEAIEANTEVTDLVPVEQDEEEVVVVRKPNRKLKIARRIIAAIVALALAIGIAHLIRSCNQDDAILGPDEPGTESTDTPETDEPTTNEPVEDDTLTTEEFENLVAQLAKALQDKNVNLTTEEITKFVAIINIDSLAEENPELAKELFKDSTKEEYIQEAAKTISETVMYNGKVFEEEKSTENFIRISDALYGEGKEQLEVIEAYVDEIAKVYYDAEQVNILVSELITKLATGDLNNLDNGTQFGMQASIELIRSYIAKDVLSDVNRDVLTDITRLDVSGIMSTYDNVNGLTGNAKTLK